VNQRWLGGMLTNFETIRRRIDRLNELEKMRDTGEFFRLPRNEIASLNRELFKLEKNFGGLKRLKRLPDVIFIVDRSRESNAIKEASRIGCSTVAIIDTNSDPEPVDHVIPSNDDSMLSVRLITGKIADAILDAEPPTGDERSGPDPQPAPVPRRPYPFIGAAHISLPLPNPTPEINSWVRKPREINPLLNQRAVIHRVLSSPTCIWSKKDEAIVKSFAVKIRLD
jgi:Ribosomal protein S2